MNDVAGNVDLFNTYRLGQVNCISASHDPGTFTKEKRLEALLGLSGP